MPLALLQLEVLRGPTKLAGLGTVLEILPTSDTGRGGVYPGQAIVVTSAARRLIELSKAAEKLDAVAVTGAIDPTLHPDFREISENLRELCKKWFPKTSLSLVTSPLNFDRSQVRHACAIFDRLFVRFEAGTQKVFAAQCGGRSANLKDAIETIAQVEHPRLYLRTTFTQGDVDNSSESEVKAWMGHVARLKPAQVQLLVPAKITVKGRKPLAKSKVSEIAAKLTEKTGIPATVVPHDG